MTINKTVQLLAGFIFGALLLSSTAAFSAQPSGVYDEAAYTEYVETTMKKLDTLYLDFCSTCNIDASKAVKARAEFFKLSRELMQHMNARFDEKNVKQGDALSPTETMVSIHVLTMLVDILTETQMQQLSDHLYTR
jgi:hypothetical protein